MDHLENWAPGAELTTENHVEILVVRLFCNEALVARGSAIRTRTNVQLRAKKVNNQIGGVYLSNTPGTAYGLSMG
jgi:hypothetical protein